MTQPIDFNETLARYLTTSKWIKRQYNAPSPKAFLPRNIDGSREVSVFRINGLSSEQIWEIADKHVLPNLPAVESGAARKIHGRADIVASAVLTKGLDIEPDDIPPRHANITGWPSELQEQLSLAQELAAAAVLIVKE